MTYDEIIEQLEITKSKIKEIARNEYGGESWNDDLDVLTEAADIVADYSKATAQASEIGLVTSLPARYAAAARKTINKQVYQILINNSNIYDGAALFGKEHKNLLASGTGVTQEAMQTMIMALANQKDQFGESIIINPATIVVPSGMKFDMYTLFFSPTINTSDNTQAVNPLYQYRDSIEVVEDPTINALCGGLGNVMPWFLIGDPGDTDFIEIDYLNGQEIPNIRRMEAPGQLGFIWDTYLDWGISVMDYRGAVKNPGIKVDTKLKLV